jgi:integrase
MATKLLTDPKVKSARSKAEKLLADGDGLYCRVRANGKDWVFIYSLRGKRRKQGLGPYPDISLEVARARARESRELVAQGLDPIMARAKREAEQIAKTAAEESRHTTRTLFEQWHKKEASKRKDKGEEIRRAFEKDVLPTLGDLYADEVKRRHIMQVLDDVKERGALRITNQILQYLRQMYRYAIKREIIETDPTYALTKKDAGGKETERDRYLTEMELRELSTKISSANLSKQAEAILWIMLATVCRVGEVCRARHKDLDLDACTWVIPAEHSKNGKEHFVHLSDFAKAQFQILTALSTSNVWVMPSRDGKSHVCEKTVQKQFRDRQRDTAMKGRSKKLGALSLSGGRWTAHDLRRTGSTLMGELGIRSDVIDRCQNHVEGKKVTRIYQRQELLPERAEAFRMLGDRLELLRRSETDRVVTGRFKKKA